MAVINKDIAYMALPLSIRRGNPFPLDEYSVWYNKTQMETYAQTSPVSYVGQVLVYVNESGSTVEAYVIQNTSGTLMKLAASTASGDLSADVLELQGKVSSLETSVGTKAGESSIVATNLWAAIEEIKAAYEAADTAINENLTTNYYNKTQTDSKIDEKIAAKVSSTYKAAGTVQFASLPTLSATEEGKVYNISDAFTTTEDFVEGAGQRYPAGTNVVCIDTADEAYKWDVLAGFVDLSAYATTESVTSGLNNKVDKVAGSSLVEDTDIAKLKALATINGVTEELEIAAETNILGVKAIGQDKITGLSDSLNGKLSGVTLGTTPLSPSDGVVTVPIATSAAIGVVKSVSTENGIAVSTDGSMTVNNINVDKLVQTDGTELILNGGTSGASAG